MFKYKEGKEVISPTTDGYPVKSEANSLKNESLKEFQSFNHNSGLAAVVTEPIFYMIV